jgi:toxin ParE1/3/4
MKNLRFSLEAKKDLFESASFIAADNPIAAEHWRNQIYEVCKLLAESPLIGRKRPELQEGLRSFPVGRFIIFYQPREEGVYIVHVVRGAMDLETVFQG